MSDRTAAVPVSTHSAVTAQPAVDSRPSNDAVGAVSPWTSHSYGVAMPSSDHSQTANPLYPHREATVSQDDNDNTAIQLYKPLTDEIHNGEALKSSSWARKTILSLDGGGVRGYASLLILAALMDKIEVIERANTRHGPAVMCSSAYPWHPEYEGDGLFYPAHYFDYIAGTSTGGLSAIMLGRLRLPVKDALEEYKGFGTSVFGNSRWFHERSILYYPRSKYASTKVRKAILTVIRNKLDKDAGQPRTDYQIANERLESAEHLMVLAFSKNRKTGVEARFLFRSYAHPPHFRDTKVRNQPVLNPGEACADPIWHAARATSAAPLYFEEFERGETVFLDGAMSANNPSMVALIEVDQMHSHSPCVLINIGTGEKQVEGQAQKKNRNREGDVLNIDRSVSRTKFFQKYLEIGDMAKKLLTKSSDEGASFAAEKMDVQYTRFDVPNWIGEHVLGGIALDEWLPPVDGRITLGKIETTTTEYLSEVQVQEELDRYAQTLVGIRRQRAQTEHWENFAHVAAYRCTYRDECRRRVGTMDRKTLRAHFRDVHAIPDDDPKLDQTMNKMRVDNPMDPLPRRNTFVSQAPTPGRFAKIFGRSPRALSRSDTNGASTARANTGMTNTTDPGNGLPPK